MTGLLILHMSQRSNNYFKYKFTQGLFFLIAGFPSLASNCEFKNKLKSPAKINVFSKVTSNFYKSEDKLFKRETCSVSILAFWKCIKTKFT